MGLGSWGGLIGTGLGAVLALPTGGMSVLAGSALGGALGSGAGAVIDGGSSAKELNTRQVEQAQAQMDFQERMSGTAHQREVADLRAAGLNPILSANGGASSPSGAMATLQNPALARMDMLSKFASSAGQLNNLRLQNEQVKTQKEQTLLTRNNHNLSYFQSAKAASEARIADNEAELSDRRNQVLTKTKLGDKAFRAGVLLNAASARDISRIYHDVVGN